MKLPVPLVRLIGTHVPYRGFTDMAAAIAEVKFRVMRVLGLSRRRPGW